MSVKTTYRQGRTEFDARAFQDYFVRKEITPADLTSNVYRIPVEAGRHVLGVRVRTATAFSGGSPSVKIGDGTDDDGFFLTTDVDITTLNSVGDSRQLGHDVTGTHTMNGYAKGGKYFASTGYILLTFASGATTGKLVVDVLFSGYEAARKDMVENLG